MLADKGHQEAQPDITVNNGRNARQKFDRRLQHALPPERRNLHDKHRAGNAQGGAAKNGEERDDHRAENEGHYPY